MPAIDDFGSGRRRWQKGARREWVQVCEGFELGHGRVGTNRKIKMQIGFRSRCEYVYHGYPEQMAMARV